ncbi:MAG: ATP-binding protein [Planctomycetaceae bacterium]|nr:ATP-binding protein [Planctomycetaceae bacterium]
MDEIQSLREALRFSPNNIALRTLIARKLVDLKRFEEAETEFRSALKYEPENINLLTDLADVFYGQGKHSAAHVITEKLLTRDPKPELLLLHARILAKTGQWDSARSYYRDAVEGNPDLETEELDSLFGVTRREFSETFPNEEPQTLIASLDGFDGEHSTIEPETVKSSFANVGGMDSVKEAVRMKIIYPLQNKDMFAAYGKKIGGGVLLYGPPGCGKTLLARATAGEIRAKFLSVGLHDILDMYIGNSEKQLHGIFEQARNHVPCVLFFDEVDALAAKRSDMRQSAGRHVINQFLSELDGMEGENEGVLILAATNAPWHVDSAFRRPGRFDRILFVPPPDQKAREAIWRIHLQGKPAESVDYGKLAASSKGFSGADIRAAVDVCIETALSDAMRLGKMVPLSQNALLASLKKTRPSTAEWFTSAKNYATYANESGTYNDILEYLRNKKND